MSTSSRITPEIQPLINNPFVVATGRVKTFLENPELNTNAPSCMLSVWNSNNLASELAAISHYIRKGAGVKVHFTEQNPIAVAPLGSIHWNYFVNPNSDDFSKATPEQKKFYRNLESWKEEAKGWTDYRIIKVEDNMESIEDSWRKFIDSAILKQRIMLDLSAIRPAGISSKGIISTGVFGIGENKDTGFLDVYTWIADHLSQGDIGSLLRLLGGLCKVIARGRKKKGGIVTTAMNYKNPLIKEYLGYPLNNILGGSKKGIRLDQGILGDRPLCDLVVDKVNSESLMLEKIQSEDLYLNVCMGILLKHKASCLVGHANAAQCESPKDLVEALCKATEFLCLVHKQWRSLSNPDPDLYLSLEEDRQVAVGWLGWANALKQWGLTYQEHVEGLEDYRNNMPGGKPLAWDVAKYLHKAYEESAKIARSHGLNRAFTIEPNQRCYQDYFDLDGFTTCRNIDPPFSQSQWRDSAVYGDVLLEHGDVEVIGDVGHDLHQRHWEEWQHIMNSTGLAHAMSFDLYKDINNEWLEDFLVRSPLVSTYYNMSQRVAQTYLDKGSVLNLVDVECTEEKCVVCGE